MNNKISDQVIKHKSMQPTVWNIHNCRKKKIIRYHYLHTINLVYVIIGVHLQCWFLASFENKRNNQRKACLISMCHRNVWLQSLSIVCSFLFDFFFWQFSKILQILIIILILETKDIFGRLLAIIWWIHDTSVSGELQTHC